MNGHSSRDKMMAQLYERIKIEQAENRKHKKEAEERLSENNALRETIVDLAHRVYTLEARMDTFVEELENYESSFDYDDAITGSGLDDPAYAAKLKKALLEIAAFSWFSEFENGTRFIEAEDYERKFYDFQAIARKALGFGSE